MQTNVSVVGGAFRVGHCTMYMDVFQNWIHLLKEEHNINALILSVDYSMSAYLIWTTDLKLTNNGQLGLAPENMYPVPVLECVAAYEYLVNTLHVSVISI